MDTEARFSYSAAEGKLEIAGSEKFVEGIFKSFENEIKKLWSSPAISPKLDHKSPLTTLSPKQDSQDLDGIAELSPDGEKVLITLEARQLGENKREQTINFIVLYLYTRSILLPNLPREVAASELRTLCKSFGCLDESNFAAHINAGKPYVNVEGGAKNKKVSITSGQGPTKAKEIIVKIHERKQ